MGFVLELGDIKAVLLSSGYNLPYCDHFYITKSKKILPAEIIVAPAPRSGNNGERSHPGSASQAKIKLTILAEQWKKG
jgi:hypothetical protein